MWVISAVKMSVNERVTHSTHKIILHIRLCRNLLSKEKPKAQLVTVLSRIVESCFMHESTIITTRMHQSHKIVNVILIKFISEDQC